MYLSIEDIGRLKKDYQNENPLNICNGIENVEGIYEVKPEDKEFIDVITSPDRVSRIILQENGLVVEKYGYSKNDYNIIGESQTGLFVFSDTKEAIELAATTMCEFIGMSGLKKTNIEIAMDNGVEVLLLMALIDIYREKTMLTLCGKETELYAIFGEIREHLDKPRDTSMVSLFKNNFHYEEPEISDTKNLLNKFIEKGIVTFDKKYKLTENYEILAMTFLVPEVVMSADILQLENNDIVSNGILYVSSGIQSNLLFVFGNDGIEISTITSIEMIEIIKNFLYCPKI